MQSKKTVKVAPSILSADFAEMGHAVEKITQQGADWIHCDVMDGLFVPNITFGPKMIRDIRKYTNIPLDVHLMIAHPEKYADVFIDSGADYLTFHIEALPEPIPLLKHIRGRGIGCGIVISPDTDVEAVKDAMPYVDLALLMSVYPGFGGQKFIERSYQRMRQLKSLRDALNPKALLEIDGGVTTDNIDAILDAGAEVIVAGSTVFGASDPAKAIARLRGE